MLSADKQKKLIKIMQNLSINTIAPHEVILDILYRIKIRDVMTSPPLTVSPEQTMAEAKKIMKDNGISGMPVVRSKQLLGVLSIYDIVECFEKGDMNEPVSRYMTTNIIVLEEEMPLSFALSYFEKYKFRRFPVLDKNKQITGIVTSRDINVMILNEINNELKKGVADRGADETDHVSGKYYKQFVTRKYDFENAGKASMAIKKFLKEIGISPAVIRRVSVAVYELEINQVVHSEGGMIRLYVEDKNITIKAADKGPGIKELDKALEEGYSTASEWIRSQGFGAGMGLPNVKKVSDDFEISSNVEKGTEVTVKIMEKQEEGKK